MMIPKPMLVGPSLPERSSRVRQISDSEQAGKAAKTQSAHETLRTTGANKTVVRGSNAAAIHKKLAGAFLESG